MSFQNCNFNNNTNCNMNWNMRNNHQNMNCGMRGPCSNRVANPSFESPLDSEWEPKFWNTSGHVTRTEIPDLIHTGEHAAFLGESASISQKIFRLTPGRQYEFSFFAKFGEKEKDEKKDNGKGNGKNGKPDHKDDLGLTATVTFLTKNRECKATEINIEAGSLSNDYNFYRAITPIIPCDIIAVRITLNVSESKVRPHVPHHFGVAIDDVSFNRVC